MNEMVENLNKEDESITTTELIITKKQRRTKKSINFNT